MTQARTEVSFEPIKGYLTAPLSLSLPGAGEEYQRSTLANKTLLEKCSQNYSTAINFLILPPVLFLRADHPKLDQTRPEFFLSKKPGQNIMSGRFVSTGAIDTKTGNAVALPPTTTNTTQASASSSSFASQKKDEWAAVQAQLEVERQAREAKRKAAETGGEKSLFEVLEANKAAKQAAFEEA